MDKNFNKDNRNGSFDSAQDNSFDNFQELDEVQENLDKKAKEKKNKPMKMHGASLRKVGEIQRKRSKDNNE